MKTLLFSCLFSIISLTSFSQAGIYRTYKDFLEDRVMEEYSEYVKTFHSFGNFTVTFLDKNGEEIKVKTEKYWGYRREDGLRFRIIDGGAPFCIVTQGKLNAYANFRTHLNEDGDLVFNYGSSYSPGFSRGDNGKLILLTKGKLKKEIKKIGSEEDLSLLKEAGKYPSDLMVYIKEFNERYAEKQAKAKS